LPCGFYHKQEEDIILPSTYGKKMLGGYKKKGENQAGFQIGFHLEYLWVSLLVIPYLKLACRCSLD
jgi:hypothetical protein